MYEKMKQQTEKLEAKFNAQQMQVAGLWNRIRELLSCCKEALTEAERYRKRCNYLVQSVEQHEKISGTKISSNANEFLSEAKEVQFTEVQRIEKIKASLHEIESLGDNSNSM